MWRVLSILPYLVPLMGSLAFGQDLCVLSAALSPCSARFSRFIRRLRSL